MFDYIKRPGMLSLNITLKQFPSFMWNLYSVRICVPSLRILLEYMSSDFYSLTFTYVICSNCRRKSTETGGHTLGLALGGSVQEDMGVPLSGVTSLPLRSSGLLKFHRQPMYVELFTFFLSVSHWI